jgi:response regulator RpfG family c-di-GMP phosphodiesterase
MNRVNTLIDQYPDTLALATALANDYKTIPRHEVDLLAVTYHSIENWWLGLPIHEQTPMVHLRVKFCHILLLYYQGDYITMYKEGYQLVKGSERTENLPYVAHIHRLMAHVSYVLSLVDPAISHAFKALRRFETIHSEEDIIKTLIVLGIIYSLVDDFELQEQYFLEALERSKKAGLTSLVRNTLSNITYLYVLSERVDKAHVTLDEASALEASQGSTTNIGIEINRLRLAIIDKEFELARQQFEKLEQMNTLKTDQSLVMDVYLLKSEFCHQQSASLELCRSTLLNGLDVALKIDSKKYQETFYRRLASSYVETNEFELAYSYQDKANHLHDLAEREKSHNQYLILRLQYEVEHISMEVKQLKDQTQQLSHELELTKYALRDTQEATIYALASLAEYRDQVTGKHILRMVKYVEVFCDILKTHKLFTTLLTDGFVRDLSKSSSLHDIGKVGISDLILNKPAKLTFEEFETIKTHTQIGRDALSIAETILGKDTFLSLAKSIAYFHHEKWDGSGYPEGLAGEDIPLEARIVAILDVYDALISERPYKRPFTHQEAIEIIENGIGNHFDPTLARLFMSNHLQFKHIAKNYSDF